jgi:serine/threonine protein kinase
MALDAARGMSYLHGQGIIHRDLKSANLLIDRSYRAKVCDFGLARAQSNIQRGGMGTAQYDAPEIILDGNQATLKSDVYSFGVVRPVRRLVPVASVETRSEGR